MEIQERCEFLKLFLCIYDEIQKMSEEEKKERIDSLKTEFRELEETNESNAYIVEISDSKVYKPATYAQYKLIGSLNNIKIEVASSTTYLLNHLSISDASDAISAAISGKKVIIR